ncbi:di-trans,poly-cis-decaprenylcistransferase [Wenzhouxiangella sp. AB-CW3]|uniref:polyprenyl diphosphate synthase n=1 Tax=Wenzhouxiangella sp. AB-CW3 TaxID=2771012 RepID=UPI00168A6B70|nr:polyprenyl diphosphate synthase [Wenzhouxiangella sp. AB-CW3]QOC23002.1 di-trans,poly-cis-decaprenylcistransferase [Wenzhouxiangella sp. AB-CW3]
MSTPDPLPHHIAIIMDGNGRWALRQGRPRTDGHEAGSDALKRTIESALRHGIPLLTVYAFSSENWRRPRSEVRKLLELFLRALNREVRELNENGVRIRFVGNRSAFNPALRDGMLRAEKQTADNQALLLNVAVNYGGHDDIARAARHLAAAVERGELSSSQIDIERFGAELALGKLPAPDLFIRTGGERRLSNFLPWELAYTELYFTDVLWPDFGVEHFEAALADFANRERRFGGLGQVRHA